MSRNPPFTQAQVRRAIRAVESAGKPARRVTFNADGSFTVDSSEFKPAAVDSSGKSLAASWDDFDGAI